jgi:hypothetical protein
MRWYSLSVRVRAGRNASYLLEVADHAVRVTPAGERVDQLQPDGEIGGRHAEHVAQAVAVALSGGSVGAARVELGERVEHVCVGARIAPELLERRARLRGSIGLRVDAGEGEPDIGTARVELARALQLSLRLGVAPCLQVRVAEIREAERIVGRELGELGERRLRLGELITLEEAEAEHARRVQLFDGCLLGARTGDEDDERDERQAPAGDRFHA